MTKNQVAEEMFYLSYISAVLIIMAGSQVKNSNRAGFWRQEPMQKLWRGAAPDLLSLLSYRTQDYQPRDGTTL